MIRNFVNTVHYEVTQLKGIPTVLNISHRIHEKLLVDGQSLQVIAPHSLPYGRHLEHRQPHHKHLVGLTRLKGVKQFDPQKIELFRRKK